MPIALVLVEGVFFENLIQVAGAGFLIESNGVHALASERCTENGVFYIQDFIKTKIEVSFL